MGKSVLVAEPARLPQYTDENGILVFGQDRLLKRWRTAKRVAGNGPRYYGIAIGSPEC